MASKTRSLQSIIREVRLAGQSCPAQGPAPCHTPNDFRVILDERVCFDPCSFTIKKSTSVTGPSHRLQWGCSSKCLPHD
ncbi:unnamed protein product [Gadus morhua 'NCC']